MLLTQAGAVLVAALALFSYTPSALVRMDSIGGVDVAIGGDGDSVDVSKTETVPNGVGRPSPGGHLASPAPDPIPSTKPFDFATCLDGWDNARPCFRAAPAAEPSDPADPSPPAAGVTLSDIAHLAPAPVAITTEPDEAGVARLPVNFTAAAATHIRTATLLGAPLTVRFTPTAYTYDYGDGTTAALTSRARTWAQLGQDPLTPTPTSHTYTEPGTYTVRLRVDYAADVDTGTGWVPVTGRLALDSAPLTLTIYTARTALVAHTCTERPTALGC